ncbi:hypothetical protein ACW9KT_15600 [Hymenobacter sp. HD11105]
MKASKSTPAPEVNTRRGVITVEIGGEMRTFKFGMNTLSAYARLHKDLPGDFSEQLSQDLIGALRDMAYCGLQVRKNENNLPEDFSPEMLGDWIDEMYQGDWDLVQSTMLGAMALGNPNRATLSKAAQ